jgi:syntaxin of plants SYP7
VALNAEIRRTKAKLLEEDLPKLQRLALKKVNSLPAFPPFCVLV